uniref:acid phosphatase n=1 Tax=Ditylenchus dipsaci TaxID=166011 RepID=A0A915ETE4_9BILA
MDPRNSCNEIGDVKSLLRSFNALSLLPASEVFLRFDELVAEMKIKIKGQIIPAQKAEPLRGFPSLSFDPHLHFASDDTSSAGLLASQVRKNFSKSAILVAWRHGDRSPTTTWKNDVNQEDVWPQGWGQLSTLGIAQHVTLGKKLRKRYIQQLQFVSESFKQHEIYMRSTDFNRTLASSMANLIGFYGETIGSDSQHQWPASYIPVHTVAASTDYICVPDNYCSRREQLVKLWTYTPEYKKLIKEKGWVFDQLTQLCGQPIELRKIHLVADTLFIENLWQKTLPIQYPKWANASLLMEIEHIKVMYEAWMSGKMKSYQGVDFGVEMAKLQGGAFLWDIINRMQHKVECLKRAEDGEGASDACKWMDRLKYYTYSVHDSTIAGLFATFGFNKTNYDKDGWPEYSACVTLELWQRPDKSFYLKVLYWMSGSDTVVKDMTADIVGCGEQCDLEIFVQRSVQYKPEPDLQTYCLNTDLGLHSASLNQELCSCQSTGRLMVLILAIGVTFAYCMFIYLLVRQRAAVFHHK